MLRTFFFLCLLVFLAGASGCNRLTTHQVLTTIFDGVPSMPEPEEYCRSYLEAKTAAEQAKTKAAATATTEKRSTHRPYAEKRCDDCHDRTKESGLKKPKKELCFLCHPNITKGAFVHGPAAVGGCTDCHDPHSSNYPALLKTDRDKICATCHKEKRLAEKMHNTIAEHGMICVDCHNPHASRVRYFLQ